MTRPSLRLPLSPEDRHLLEALLRETFEPKGRSGDDSTSPGRGPSVLPPSREIRP